MFARVLGVVMVVAGIYLMPWSWQVEPHPVGAGVGVALGYYLVRKGTFDASSW